MKFRTIKKNDTVEWLKREGLRIFSIGSALFCIFLFFQGAKYGIWGIIIASVLIGAIKIATQYSMFKNIIISGGDYLINAKKVREQEYQDNFNKKGGLTSTNSTKKQSK